jgi:putative membrane protein
MGRLLLRWIMLAFVIGVVAEITPGIVVHGGFGTLLWVALLFGLVSSVLGPLLKMLSLPLIVLTLGLFLLVVNAALLEITAAITDRLSVNGFGSAVLGGFLIAIFGWALDAVIPGKQRAQITVRRIDWPGRPTGHIKGSGRDAGSTGGWDL